MSDQPSDILIFGAGYGTRMAPLTDTTPKPLIHVAGRALIDYGIEHSREVGLKIHVNAHYRAPQMRDHLPDDIHLHIEDPDILDTGGGLKAALPKMDGSVVATLNSDAVWNGPNPLQILLSAWRPEMDALLLLVPQGQTVGYTRRGNFVKGPHATLMRSEEGEVYTGAQLIRRSLVRDHSQDVFSLNVVWDQLLKNSGLFGVTYPGEWADVGTPDGIPLAENMLADRNV